MLCGHWCKIWEPTGSDAVKQKSKGTLDVIQHALTLTFVFFLAVSSRFHLQHNQVPEKLSSWSAQHIPTHGPTRDGREGKDRDTKQRHRTVPIETVVHKT